MNSRISFLAVVLGTALVGVAVSHASAHEPHPGLQFSISIDGLRGCNTREGDATCTIPAGATFTLKVQLDTLPHDIPNYGGFDTYLEYTGVRPLHDVDMSVWPDCGFPASFYGDGFMGFGCAVGVPPAGPSTYGGTIAKNSFVCERPGSISLLHGNGDKTDLIEPQTLEKHSEGAGTHETINVTCSEPPSSTPVPTGTSTLALPTTGQHPSEGDVPLWLVPVVLGAAALSLLAGLLLHRAR